MRSLKKLSCVAFLCCLISMAGVNAEELKAKLVGSTNDNYLSMDYNTPPHNGFITTPRRTKKVDLQKQAIRYAYTVPSYDSLDVMLKRTDAHESYVQNASTWRIISSAGDDIIFNDAAALKAGAVYYLHIDSRAHYTKPTRVVGSWYLDDNK